MANETLSPFVGPDEHERARVLVQEWFRRARQNQRIHYQCADHFANRNRWLGIPTIVMSTLVGSAVFASIYHETSGAAKVVVGLLSILAAVLASLQTFLSYSERAERHRLTSARYASVRRQLEFISATEHTFGDELLARLDALRSELDSCADGAPHVPQHIVERVSGELDDTRKIAGKHT